MQPSVVQKQAPAVEVVIMNAGVAYNVAQTAEL
jgi:hypothetical protein